MANITIKHQVWTDEKYKIIYPPVQLKSDYITKKTLTVLTLFFCKFLYQYKSSLLFVNFPASNCAPPHNFTLGCSYKICC